MKRQIIFSILIFILYGCESPKWNISELYAQKIEGTSKILYKYDAWGGRDSHVSGFIILDSTKPFEIDLKNNLSLLNLSEIPNKEKIEGIAHECYNSCGESYYKTKPIFSPMKIDNTASEKINIETFTYQYRGYSEKEKGLRGDYVFEKCLETKDSIKFYNLNDVISVNETHLDELTIKKGEVYLQENNKGEVVKIVVNQTTVNPKSKEIVESKTYFLKPKNKIKKNYFSERGIFKEI